MVQIIVIASFVTNLAQANPPIVGKELHPAPLNHCALLQGKSAFCSATVLGRGHNNRVKIATAAHCWEAILGRTKKETLTFHCADESGAVIKGDITESLKTLATMAGIQDVSMDYLTIVSGLVTSGKEHISKLKTYHVVRVEDLTKLKPPLAKEFPKEKFKDDRPDTMQWPIEKLYELTKPKQCFFAGSSFYNSTTKEFVSYKSFKMKDFPRRIKDSLKSKSRVSSSMQHPIHKMLLESSGVFAIDPNKAGVYTTPGDSGGAWYCKQNGKYYLFGVTYGEPSLFVNRPKCMKSLTYPTEATRIDLITSPEGFSATIGAPLHSFVSGFRLSDKCVQNLVKKMSQYDITPDETLITIKSLVNKKLYINLTEDESSNKSNHLLKQTLYNVFDDEFAAVKNYDKAVGRSNRIFLTGPRKMILKASVVVKDGQQARNKILATKSLTIGPGKTIDISLKDVQGKYIFDFKSKPIARDDSFYKPKKVRFYTNQVERSKLKKGSGKVRIEGCTFLRDLSGTQKPPQCEYRIKVGKQGQTLQFTRVNRERSPLPPTKFGDKSVSGEDY